MHPALETSYGISSDILSNVFDWFFVEEIFATWRDRKTTWQLHCIGGPGAGKTTLTALVARHLKSHPKLRQYPIVSVFISQDVPDHENYFIQDFLETVYHGLAEDRFIEDDQSDDLYDEYDNGRLLVPEGSSISRRLKLIRNALHLRLQALKNSRAFLLLDGIERCDPTLRLLLESEISQIQEAGISIFLASRIAVFGQSLYVCDHANHDGATDDDPFPVEYRDHLRLFLMCKQCKDVLCFPCKDAGRIHSCLASNGNSNLYEPYDHVNIPLMLPEQAMKDFIAWSLEREHGDLGLDSTARKPPLSPLGKSLMSAEASKSVQRHANDVFDCSWGNISIAKARLDVIHGMESLDMLETREDQLPATLITMFNMGVKRIEAQHATQRDIALKALAASASFDHGVSIPHLREQLESLGTPNIRSGEEIIEAARGFLIVNINEHPQTLTVFDENLTYYIKQRYHRAIHRASIQLEPQLRFEPQNVSTTPTPITPYKIERSVTGLDTITEAPAPSFLLRKGTRAWK